MLCINKLGIISMTTEYSPPSSCLPLSYKIVTLRNNETLQGHSFASLDPDEGRIKRRWPDAHGLLGRRQFIVCLSRFYSAREGTRRPLYARASSKFLPSPYTKIYSRLPITRTLANSSLTLTRTEIDSPGFPSYIHGNFTFGNSNPR